MRIGHGVRLVMAVTGAALAAASIGVGIWAWAGSPAGHPRPTPSAHVHRAVSAGPLDPQPAGSSGATTAPSSQSPGLSAAQSSAPVRIAIPSLGITSALGPPRGLNPNGTIEDAPLSGPVWSLPWWYDGGPSPGEAGSSVLLGHVDSAIGAGTFGVFYRLGDLTAGATLTVTLQNGLVTHWVTVSDILYTDAHFPDSVVYSPTGPPMLRLVTYGGTYDSTTHEYLGVVVVTASLTGVTGPS